MFRHGHVLGRRLLAVVGGTLALAFAGSSWAAVTLSDNLLAGPASDFENAPAALKLADSPLTPDEVTAGTQPVRAWQFHPEFDLGKWIGGWGASAVDDPRAAWALGQGTAPTNISLDPLNPGNHVLEGARFRPTAGLILPAPENHVAGEAYINFDYYWNNWVEQPSVHEAASIFKMWIYGFNEEDLPTWQDRYGPDNNGPANGDGEFDGYLWTNPNWSEWGWSGPGQEEPAIPSLGDQWNNLAVTDPSFTTFDITEAYDYYYIALYMVTFAEGSPYFWLYSPNPGPPADTMAVALDNIVLKLSVEVDDGPAPVPADFNVSGTVNTEDINPFILALTNTPGWIDSVRALLPDGWSDQQIIDYADPNQDGVINTEDINPFICWLTGGSNCAGGGAPAIIPEPASLALLGMGALALIRRRR